MITEFKVKGYWRENEASGAASALLSRHDAGDEFTNSFHIQVQAETEDGTVRIIGDLDAEQVAVLRNYFENHPEQDMPQWERDKLAAEKLRREALLARIAKVTDDTGVALKAKDVRDALRALAEVVGLEV